MTKSLLAIALVGAAAATANADLIAHWNFNDSTPNTLGGALGVLNTTAPDSGVGTLSFGSGLILNTNAAGTADGNVGTFAGSTLNAVGADGSGGALSITGGIGGTGEVVSNGGTFTFGISMAGYEDLQVSFATRGTGTGFHSGQLSYSTDGMSFTDFGPTWDGGASSSFFVVTRDLTGAAGIDGASDVFIRITLDGATGASGNNRFDNVQFNASVVPAPGAVALLGLGGLVASRRRRA